MPSCVVGFPFRHNYLLGCFFLTKKMSITGNFHMMK